MRKLGLLLPVVVLAACSSAPEKLSSVQPPKMTGFVRGIDVATDVRDVSNELKGSPLDFVARYYRHSTSRWPTLSAEEALTVSAMGKQLVAVFESHSHKPEYFSHEAGYRDGITAHQQARAIGQPAGSAIYFAVDYNAPQPDIAGPIEQYFRGVHAGLAAAAGRGPEYRVGVYGSGAVCSHLKRTRLAQYAWLSGSTAWSGYGSFADWNIRQSKRSTAVSFDHTMNEARGDFGAFKVNTQYTSL